MKIFKPYREIYSSLLKQDIIELRRQLNRIKNENRHKFENSDLREQQ
jgi:hypothetical protein